MSSLVGQMLGRYKILEQIGLGGMATVFKAQDTRLDRFVAIKVIRADQFAPSVLEEVRKRFEREAKALAKLSHPNIVRVHDYGDYEGAPYLVMEYIPGGTLKDRAEIPIPWQQSVQIILPIAYALAYAHEHNIIHRDIKPANILLGDKGMPMLTDFGIAKLLENTDGGTLTGTSTIIGTPEYMAPEQWAGEVTQQSDIYSLGVVLYELVTGRKPYTANTPMSVMLKQNNEPLPRPSQFVPDLPKGLENVLIKALEKRPADRYQNMNEFAAALESLTKGETMLAGVNPDPLRAEKTILAPGGYLEGTKMAPAVEDGKTRLSAVPDADIPASAKEQSQPKSNRRRIWIPVGALAMLLCIGVVAAAVLAFKPEPSVAFNANHAQVKVLWDTSHKPRSGEGGVLYTPDGRYKSLAQALARENFSITSGDLSNLNSYDILVLSEMSGSTSYTAAEAGEIEQYVRQAGHSVLILSDSPSYENLADVIASKFSISLGELNSSNPVTLTSGPLFSGVNSIDFVNSGGIFLVSPPAQIAAVDQNGAAVIAYCECDNGRVVGISNANLWDNRAIKQADNQRFALNVFNWLAKISQ